MNRHAFDIRQYKRNLRAHYKQKRQRMAPGEKAKKDEAIYQALLGMPQYRDASAVLCFVSTPIEVDTHRLIDHALSQGKRVAVPYCIDGTREMKFYCITSREQLVRRTFGVLEPVPEECEQLTEFQGSVCILPGLAFDRRGYRLGYGGGYYDRFLSKIYTEGVRIGVCYDDCTRSSLMHGRYDVPSQYVVTEKGAREAEKTAFAGGSTRFRQKRRKKGQRPLD